MGDLLLCKMQSVYSIALADWAIKERLSIKSLQCDENVIILWPDKGNATVVMNKVEYSDELVVLIDNGGNFRVK